MIKYHHNTTRKYTASLINLFNKVEVQYVTSDSKVESAKIPLNYSNRDKFVILDSLSDTNIKSGNYNILPIGFLSLISIERDMERARNKNLKIGTQHKEDSTDYMYNSIPYNYNFELNYLCRGMNEATQIIEQIVPMFNPNYHIDIHDGINTQKPTRINIRMTDVQFETENYDALSSNLVTVQFSLILSGFMYMPILSTSRVKEFDLTLNTTISEDEAIRNSMQEWDVDSLGKPF